MKPKTIGKILVDCGMTAILLLLMAFELVGRAAHEWLGLGIFILFIVHHVLNRKWSRNVFHGRYTPIRTVQTVLAVAALLTMVGSAVSSVLISREVFIFLPVSTGRAFGRTLHLLCAYWGFVFLSLHLGIHWNMMISMAKKLGGKSSSTRRTFLQIVGICIAVYGAYAFVKRGLPEYLFLQTHFVFFDFEEPLVFFFLDYLAIMGLFVWVGHSLSKALHALSRRQGRKGEN